MSTNGENIPCEYQAIYLSPHLDDAALSCGGQIYQRTQNGEKILIATVMAGNSSPNLLSSYAQSLHDRWKINSETVKKRREEDRQAAEVLGADVVHLSIPDCIYRFHKHNNKPLYTSDEQIFGDIHPDEARLVDNIAEMIDHLPCHSQLFIPLGVGNHVDHCLTRAAAEKVINCCHDPSPKEVWYYEEYPYAQTKNATEDVLYQTKAIWQLNVIGITEMALSQRIRAIAQFQSQISTFFRSYDDMAAQVYRFVHEVGGERLWCKRKFDI
ncbi:MAG: PIG-L family deacetylase, partial [Symploca sp. SIO2G7]|nr:PIG-L family deacetylase [Symploca sp. SIO2G7]